MAVGLKTQIWNNQIKSVLLLIGFPLLLLGLLWLFFFLVALFSPQSLWQVFHISNSNPLEVAVMGVRKYWLYPAIGCAVWYVIASFCYQTMLDVFTGARPLERSEMPKLYSMLEALCISRGLSMPKLYIIDTEALNAFASGLSPGHYAITVTSGIVKLLSDEEMETVLAHELTHIINKDSSLMMVGIIFAGILGFFCDVLYQNFRFGAFSSRSDRDNKLGGLLVIAFIVFLIGRMFSFFIRMALSRKREYLADAGSVELTKNPTALIGALKKISQNPELPHMAGNVSCMCIEDAHEEFLSVFSTHPPINDRIKALEMMGGTQMPW